MACRSASHTENARMHETTYRVESHVAILAERHYGRPITYNLDFVIEWRKRPSEVLLILKVKLVVEKVSSRVS